MCGGMLRGFWLGGCVRLDEVVNCNPADSPDMHGDNCTLSGIIYQDVCTYHTLLTIPH